MRVLYNPVNVFKNIFGLDKPSVRAIERVTEEPKPEPKPEPTPVPTPETASRDEAKAREEAARKARAAASRRQGVRSTLLSGQPAGGVSSSRKVLLGSSP